MFLVGVEICPDSILPRREPGIRPLGRACLCVAKTRSAVQLVLPTQSIWSLPWELVWSNSSILLRVAPLPSISPIVLVS